MNILFESITYSPHIGGAEGLIEDLANIFSQKGHRVTIVTSKIPITLPSFENKNGVDIIRLNYPPQNYKNLKQIFLIIKNSFLICVKLHRIIRGKRINTVCIGLVGTGSFFILMLKKVMKFKLVVYIHGSEIRKYVTVSKLMRWALKKIFKNCNAVITVSNKLKEEVVEFAPFAKNRVFSIFNGCDFKKIKSAQIYEYPYDYILYAGRLHPVKGVGILIKAFSFVCDRVPNLKLIIAGGGSEEGDLITMVGRYNLQERVNFLGILKKEEVFSLLRGCQFSVLPSYSEGCPNIILEAMAAGKMSIGSRVEGISEIIEDGITGRLFKAGDPTELGNLILEYYTNKTARYRVEANIKNSNLEEKYDIQKIYEKHLSVYKEFKERLNICIISAFYYQDHNCTGLSSYYYNLSKALADLGHNIFLVTLKDNQYPRGRDNFSVMRIKQNHFFQEDTSIELDNIKRIFARFFFSLKSYLKANKLNQKVGVDVVIAPELFGQGLFVGLFMKRKLITRVHTPTYISDAYNNRYKCKFIGKILSIPERIQTRLSLAISTASENLAFRISKDWKIDKEKIRIIPNGVQVELIRQIADSQKKLLDGDYLLYFGRLERRKGTHIISNALSDVFAERPEIKMLFIGRDGGIKKEILRDNRPFLKNIIFFDTLDKERLFGFIKYAKLIILPSLFENHPNACLEAMSLGKPVIGTFGTGFEEIIEDNENGFLVRAGDPRALSEKILFCLGMTDLEEIGQNAYIRALRFNIEKITSENVEFFRQAISLL